MTPTTTALRRTPSLLDLAALGVAALALAACANNGDDLGGGAPAKCEFTGIRVCDARAPDLVFDVDSCGNYGTELGYTRCLGDYTDCITDENAPGGARCGCPPQVPEVLGCLPEGAQSIDNPTEIGPVDSCGYIWEVTQTCMLGERCWYHWDDGGNIVGDPFCATSIDPRHRGSEFYTMGCDIDLYMAAPTDLPMDCRCNRSNAQMQACRPAAEAWDAGLRVGAGPHTRGVNLQKWGGGFLSKERKELFAAVHYTGGQVDVKPGAVYAFNYETGDRRVVSGSYEDETGWHDVGSGDTFDGEILPFAVAAKLGADGQIYVAGSDTLNHVTIFRVDPDTGDRKLVWRRQTDAEGMDAAFPFGQCWSGRVSPNYPGGYAPVQYAERAFALADDGGFYLGWNNDGVGVVHISADGATCTIVSRWASRNLTAPLPDIGGGVSLQYSTITGLLHRDGVIYAQTRDVLLAIDDETGDRSYFANVSGIGGVGETNFFVDEARQLFFACGGNEPRKCSVHDLADGNHAQGLFQIGQAYDLLPGQYPVTQGAKGALDNNNYTGYGAVALDPDDPNIMYFLINYGLVKYEIDTGNSYTISLLTGGARRAARDAPAA